MLPLGLSYFEKMGFENPTIAFGKIRGNENHSFSGVASVGEIGLEPTTSAMSTRCSNQLSYPPERMDIITRERGFDNTRFSRAGHVV
jgi:hypothetical protein